MDEETKRDIEREIKFSIRELGKSYMSDYLYGLLVGQLTVFIWFRDGRGDWSKAGDEARALAERARAKEGQ